MTKATYLGERLTSYDAHEIVYRLTRPLPSYGPDWFTIMVQTRANGTRRVHRANSYQKADGTWSVCPGTGSWIACFHPIPAPDMALIESEIA